MTSSTSNDLSATGPDLRVGIVGCGYWGEKHARVFASHPLVQHVIAIDGREPIRMRVKEANPSISTASTLDSVIDELDAVVIATPPETHFELAAAALSAGKHALVEKPMTTSSAQAYGLIDLAERNGATLAAGHTFAHNASARKLADLASSGALGKLHHIDAARLNLGLYRRDVNVIWDLAAHDISITHMIVGRRPDSVSAWGMTHTDDFGVDVASIRLSYEAENVDSVIRVSWLDPMKVRRTTVVGADKMAIYNDMRGDEQVKIMDRGRERTAGAGSDTTDLSYRYGDVEAPFINLREPLREQADDFIEACLLGTTPVADGHAGLDVVSVLEASDMSLANNGLPVPLAELTRPALAASA